MDDPKEIANKLFDCAESVIQEWIADYFGVEISEVFNEYEDNSSVIGFTHNNVQYNAYLITMEPGCERLVDDALIRECEDARKTCSMLFDGAYHVYSALAATAKDEYKERLRGMSIKFDEPTMSFQLVHINVKAAELQAANDQNNKIRELIQRGDELNEEQKSALMNSVAKIKAIMLENTREVLDAAELECREKNKVPPKMLLHIAIEEADDENKLERIEEGMSRMPTFGTQYRNPDDTNFIEELCKEN